MRSALLAYIVNQAKTKTLLEKMVYEFNAYILCIEIHVHDYH